MLKPLEDRVIVKLVENEQITKSGILLADTETRDTRYAKVVEVGVGTKDISMQVEKGQKVIIKNDVGYKIDDDNDEFFIVKQNDILAIVV